MGAISAIAVNAAGKDCPTIPIRFKEKIDFAFSSATGAHTLKVGVPPPEGAKPTEKSQIELRHDISHLSTGIGACGMDSNGQEIPCGGLLCLEYAMLAPQGANLFCKRRYVF